MIASRLAELGLDAEAARRCQLWFDGASVPVTAQGKTSYAAAKPSDWQGNLVTLRASAGDALLGVRNTSLDCKRVEV